MYRRMSAYNREQVIDWVNGMAQELDAYKGRMSSMINSALDTITMQQVVQRLVAQDMTIKQHRILEMGSKPEPAAWALVCERV